MVKQSDAEISSKIIADSPFIVISRKLDDDLPVSYVSDNIKQFGYSPVDFTSRAMNFSEIVHPDDLNNISKTFKYLNPVITAFEQEYRVITKFGEIRYVEEKSQIRREENGDYYIDGVIIDITGKKHRKVDDEVINANVGGKDASLEDV